MSNKKKMTILVVDDNPQNLQFVANLLSGEGYEIALAQNGLQALDYLKENKPDLILLDVMMPDMDGFQVCAKLKADMTLTQIPVIFLTARTEIENIVKGFEAGGIDYITKPFNSTELLARVKTHIELRILRGMVPICSKCKKIRDDEGMWNQIETYFENYADLIFTHSICPTCMKDLFKNEDWYRKIK